jgi:hypothetical protein
MTELLLWKLMATTRLRQKVGVRLWTLGVAVQKVGSFTLCSAFSFNEMPGHCPLFRISPVYSRRMWIWMKEATV